MSERNWRYLSYLRKHLIAARMASPNGAAPTPARTESTMAASEPPREPGEPESTEKKYTLAEAFDYFVTLGDEQPPTSQINNERCIRAVAFLLHYCSQHGNADVYGFIAHGLAHVLEQCASEVERPDEHRQWLREHGGPSV